jgi:hypothetical protein
MDGIIHCFTYLKVLWIHNISSSLQMFRLGLVMTFCGDLNRGVHGRAWDHNTWQERNLKGVGVMVLDGIKSPTFSWKCVQSATKTNSLLRDKSTNGIF